MRTPIEIMMDGVEWCERDSSEPAPEEGLYATHEGVFEFLGHRLRCYRLNNGAAVINADDVEEFFGSALQ
jgi:hypothetical protein